MIMKMCSFEIETFFRVPFDYENEYESIMLELTDEQFNRYCDALRWWEATDEWKNWDIENGDDYFIHWDLQDIWQLLVEFAEFARGKFSIEVQKSEGVSGLIIYTWKHRGLWGRVAPMYWAMSRNSMSNAIK